MTLSVEWRVRQAETHGRCTTSTYLVAYTAGEVAPTQRTFVMRFGSWSNALDAAGLPTVHRGPYANRVPQTGCCHGRVLRWTTCVPGSTASLTSGGGHERREKLLALRAENEWLRRELGKRDDFLYRIRNVGQEYERHLEDLEREARS